jgi:hypothetical protein
VACSARAAVAVLPFQIAASHQAAQAAATDAKNGAACPSGRHPTAFIRYHCWSQVTAMEASDMKVRIGQILIDQGVLTAEQSEQILSQQQQCGQPFGVLCERMFNVDPEVVERAWALQYAAQTRTIDPLREAIDDRALNLVTRRQAWQFRVLPLRFDGPELMIATTQVHLRRALRFTTNVISVPAYLVMAASDALGEALCRYYPLPGMTARAINDEGMDWLFDECNLRTA